MTCYVRPDSKKAALRKLAEPGQRVVPLFYPPRAKALHEWEADTLMDLSNIGLDTIEYKAKEIRIGSMVTLETLAKSSEIANLFDGVLSKAALLSSNMAMRNLATIGGVLMNPNLPAEITLVLLALDAKIIISKNTGREERISIEDFLKNVESIAGKGSLITAVCLPITTRTHLVMERVSRTEKDISIVSVIVRGDLTQKKAHNLHISIFGADETAKRMTHAEKALTDDSLTANAMDNCVTQLQKDMNPISDFRGSAEYRAAMCEVLTRRALIGLRHIAIGKDRSEE